MQVYELGGAVLLRHGVTEIICRAYLPRRV